MIYLLNISILGIIGWSLCKTFYQKFGTIALWGMVAKTLGATCLGWVYFYYYEGGDTIGLWQQVKAFNEYNATDMANYWHALFAPINPYQGNPRSIFFVRLLGPLGLLSQNSYVFLSGYLCLFSYWTSWKFIAAYDRFYPKLRPLAMAVFCFLPTYLFWTSGLLKDTLSNGALFYLTASLLIFYHDQRLSIFQWVCATLLFVCLFMTRHYLAGLFSIIAVLLLMDNWIKNYGLKARLALFLSISCLGAYSIRFFFIRLRPERFPITFHELHRQFLSNFSAGSNIHFDLQPTWWSLLSNLPKSLFTGLFRPGLWEVSNVFQVLESLQSTVLMIGFFLSLVLLRKVKAFPQVALAVALFILVLATCLPLAAPNFGSLSRYRVAFTPFLAFLILYLPYRQFVGKDL